jgi:hypothetical protein
MHGQVDQYGSVFHTSQDQTGSDFTDGSLSQSSREECVDLENDFQSVSDAGIVYGTPLTTVYAVPLHTLLSALHPAKFIPPPKEGGAGRGAFRYLLPPERESERERERESERESERERERESVCVCFAVTIRKSCIINHQSSSPGGSVKGCE